jgi:hypothetical protein
MISERNLRAATTAKNQIWRRLIEPFIFIITFIISYGFSFNYNNDTSLFNDKLIDVCSIFIGIFVGCLFLFERFKNSQTYRDFLKFCKNLLYLNLLIIAYSFIIILTNPTTPHLFAVIIVNQTLNLKIKVLIFSIYISIFTIVIYRMVRFINMILIILKSSQNTNP